MKDLSSKINPYLTYTVETKDLKKILLDTDGWYFYDGYVWDIKSKSLGAGVYSVYSKRRD